MNTLRSHNIRKVILSWVWDSNEEDEDELKMREWQEILHNDSKTIGAILAAIALRRSPNFLSFDDCSKSISGYETTELDLLKSNFKLLPTEMTPAGNERYDPKIKIKLAELLMKLRFKGPNTYLGR